MVTKGYQKGVYDRVTKGIGVRNPHERARCFESALVLAVAEVVTLRAK